MTAESVAPEIEKIRKQVTDLSQQAMQTLDEIDGLTAHLAKLRHDQQSLRQTLVAILDVIDHIEKR